MRKEGKSTAGGIRQSWGAYFEANQYLKFIAPAMGVMILLSIVPTIFLLVISFTNYQLGWDFSRARFAGIENFLRLFSGRDPDFWHSVWISLSFMFLATGIEIFLGFWIASLLNASEFKLKPLVIGIMIIPLAMTPSIAAQMWKLMLNAEYGVLNHILGVMFKAKVIWLSQDMAFWSVLLVDIWQFTPFVTLIIYAGLRSIPGNPTNPRRLTGRPVSSSSSISPCP